MRRGLIAAIAISLAVGTTLVVTRRAVLFAITGIPQPVISGGEANLRFSPMPIFGAVPFSWREVGCWSPGVHGTFPSNLNVRDLIWTAPRNLGNTAQDCRIEGTASSSIGSSTYSAVYVQTVGP